MGPDDPYLAGIVRKVSHSWLKPRVGLPATSTTVFFELSPSGAVANVRVETSSGVPLYDRSAQRAIDLAAPFPPPPASHGSDGLRVHFEFIP